MMPERFHLHSFAKINLALKVLGKRMDGYHEIETVFQTVSLADRIEFEFAGRGIEVDCCGSEPGQKCDVPSGRRNIVYSAIELLRKEWYAIPGIRVHIEKRIPPGSGLGGGSSNAAATLLALKRHLSLNIDLRKMLEMAARLGSDVPFFLWGGTAMGMSRGDDVIPLRDAGHFWVALAIFPEKMNTAEAYAKLSPLLTNREDDTNIKKFIYSIFKGNIDFSLAENDFEHVIGKDGPDLKLVRDIFEESGARKSMLTGSGSAFYGFFDSHRAASKAADEVMRKGSRCDCMVVETVGSRDYHERIYRLRKN
ncbi:MAG: 4-(cytidine 5'-diphospho)-2-C-methyl-D-erythritol kinase [Acidobacteriota bacterium]